MPLNNFQVTVTGANTTTDTAAKLTATAKTFDIDFSDADYTATIAVDGGMPQDLVLNQAYATLDDLVADLQSQTTGATWSEQDLIVDVTSDTTGVSSELDFVLETNTKDIFIESADVLGTEVITTGATLLWQGDRGTQQLPQQVTIQNAGSDDDISTGPMLEVGGKDVTFGEGLKIPAGGAWIVPLEVFEAVYATADDSTSVDTRVIVTRS